ncbi:MAG: fumarylacetoacetate hydrolase family protein [Dokdonella sp.]
MNYAFPPQPQPGIPVLGTDLVFPVHRIYCIGRNYADHAREMGARIDRGQPVFFSKPADAVVSGSEVRYPPATSELHHEVEMIVALASGGRDIRVEDALGCVFGYGVGLDLTRRDLQARAKQNGTPWDTAKGFDESAPVSALTPLAACGHPREAALSLRVNGELRQHSDIREMVFSVAEIIHELSKLYDLCAGDLIFTGTPAGVAALQPDDRFEAALGDIAALSGRIVVSS